MERKFTPFLQPPQRALSKPATERLPSVDEITAFENELKALQTRTTERVTLVDANIAALERLAKKMKEKDKLKVKVLPKVRRGSTATSEVMDLTHDPSVTSVNTPVPSASSTSLHSSSAPRPPKANSLLDVSLNNKKNNKKRRRESQAPEEEEATDMVPPPPQKPRKSTPPPVASSSSHKVKASAHSKVNASGFRIAEDFSLPNRSYIPARPKLLTPIPAGPRTVAEVMDDFTKVKQPPKQEPIHIFHASVEPYTRPLREEDLAFLDYTGDEDDPFLIPALGRHYLEVWEDEDALYDGREPRMGVGPPRPAAPPPTNWNPGTLVEADMTSEQHGFGPIAERIVGGLLVDPNIKADLDPAASAGLDPWKGEPRAPHLNAADLEGRMRKQLQSIGLLTDEEPDFAQLDDDQLVSELRTCQRLLRDQIEINRARKARLLELAQDRVAYQEYLDSKESIERNILAAFAKLQKPRGPPAGSSNKKKKLPAGARPEDAGPLPHPAVAGLVLSNDGQLGVPPPLRSLIEVRNQFVRAFGAALEQRESEAPGSIYGLPSSSVFADLDIPKDPDPGKRARP